MRASRLILSLLATFALSAAACGSATEEDPVGESGAAQISSSVRMQRYTRIRDVANENGLENTAYLLAGIAQTETQLAQCLSELPWACPGPASPDCGGGPVVAGRFDPSCPDGGLGIFQFDAGKFKDTLAVYGNKVLTVDGQVALAVDYVIDMVQKSEFIPSIETPQQALDWLRAFSPNDRGRRDQWVKTVLRHYNGCKPSWSCWNERLSKYDQGLQTALDDTGGVNFWRSRATECPGGIGRVLGAIEAKYLSVGGCGSFLGVPTTDERRTPDRLGRYSVFKNGSIYWTEKTGAQIVVGKIRDRWAQLGWEAGALGYPTQDERAAKRGSRYSQFQKGAVYYTEALGAHEILGAIYTKWAELGSESGKLGLPTTGEYDIAGGKRSDFEHGFITWDSTAETATVTFEE